MKRLLTLAALAATLLLPAAALAAETIDSFKVQATLTSERSLTITETITYDFGETPRHGIYREIPVGYSRNGASYKLHLENIHVTMDGAPARFETSQSGGRMSIKIGDPDQTIEGKHVYDITYQTDRAINFFEDHSELYWNVTGNEWQVPIAEAEFTVGLPEAVQSSPTTDACFTGPFGSTEAECDIRVRDRFVTITATRLLNAEEGMTVVIGIPAGVIREPSVLEKIWMVLRDNGILGVPLAIFILMFRVWWTHGRDPQPGTIIPHYESPEKLTPAELAAVQEEGALSSRGVTATILALARHGYLHIRYGEEKGLISKSRDYTLVKIKEDDDELSKPERILFKGLFEKGAEVALDELQKNKFYVQVHKAKEAVWKDLEAKRLFDKRPAMVRAVYLAAGFATTLLMLFFVASLPLAWFAAILTGLIIAGFGWYMPRRTQKGARLFADVKGFEWFMSVTEKERLEFHNAPQRTPAQFEALLPFAIALGVEEAWAKQFQGIDLPPPNWAEGNVPMSWSSAGFVSGLHSFHSQASSSGYLSPSSSGSGGSGFSGGGSGGGGGGGGGGSW